MKKRKLVFAILTCVSLLPMWRHIGVASNYLKSQNQQPLIIRSLLIWKSSLGLKIIWANVGRTNSNEFDSHLRFTAAAKTLIEEKELDGVADKSFAVLIALLVVNRSVVTSWCITSQCFRCFSTWEGRPDDPLDSDGGLLSFGEHKTCLEAINWCVTASFWT